MLESMNSLREAILVYYKLTPCIVSKNHWNTKVDNGKSMMHALYILWLAKGRSQDKAMIAKVCLAEGINK